MFLLSWTVSDWMRFLSKPENVLSIYFHYWALLTVLKTESGRRFTLPMNIKKALPVPLTLPMIKIFSCGPEITSWRNSCWSWHRTWVSTIDSERMNSSLYECAIEIFLLRQQFSSWSTLLIRSGFPHWQENLLRKITSKIKILENMTKFSVK